MNAQLVELVTHREPALSILRPQETERRFMRWYVVETHPKAEADVAELISDAGFPVFLPTYRKRCRMRGRLRPVMTLPLFPRYVFAGLVGDDLARSASAVRRLDGVSGLLPHREERPRPLPIGAIEELRANQGLRDLAFEEFMNRRHGKGAPAFQAGEGVRVRSHFGIAGTVLVSTAERVRVLLAMFNGRETEVDVPVAEVEAA